MGTTAGDQYLRSRPSLDRAGGLDVASGEEQPFSTFRLSCANPAVKVSNPIQSLAQAFAGNPGLDLASLDR